MLLTTSYSNSWEDGDERFKGLLEIANAINTAVDLASGDTGVVAYTELSPDEYPCWTPLRLAERLREATERIEKATASEGA